MNTDIPSPAPTLAEAVAHFQAGRHAEAETVCRDLLRIAPRLHQALFLLGLTARAAGNNSGAIEHLQTAVSLAPNVAAYHNHLSVYLEALQRFSAAEAAARQALALQPAFPEAFYNLGLALHEQGRLDEAETAYRQALALAPKFAHAENNLGAVLAALERPSEAEAAYRRALAVEPDSAEIHKNLGQALQAQGRLDEALAACERSLACRPGYDWGENNLGTVLKEQGRVVEAIAAYRRALAVRPDFVVAHSNLLMDLHFLPTTTLATLAQAHTEWDEKFARPWQATWRPFANDPDPQRPLRLGFVSADFTRHPVGYFLVRVLECLDRNQFQTVCYATRVLGGDLTERIAAAADTWRTVHAQSDDALAQQIRADQIDVLFDLAGHTCGNRLLVFARKPAPIQISWMGYVGTTGLAAMDYVLADRFQAPPNAELHYRERILRMPDGYICYDPPALALDVGALPAAKRGFVTFGSFNNLAKIGPHVLKVWATILSEEPSARLLLKFRGLDDPVNQRRYREMFRDCGGDEERLDLEGGAPRQEFLQAYNRMDIALDPFPYSGGLTTCEALWMGVPVITCAGETFASRHALSHLSNVGLEELVADNWQDYVTRALNVARDLPRLSRLRAELRGRLVRSPLCDGPRFAGHLQKMVRDCWRTWCNTANSS